MPNSRRPLTENDIEQLSTYLDGVLADSERAALETRLNTDPDLRAELDELRQTIALIKTLAPLRAPRNFTLTREMVGDVMPAARADQRGGAPPRSRVLFLPTSALFSALSAAAAVLLFVIGAGLLVNTNMQSAPNNLAFEQVALAPSDTVGRDARTDVGSISGASPASAAEDVFEAGEQDFTDENSTGLSQQQGQDDSTLQAFAPPAADTTDRDEAQARSQSATQMSLTPTPMPMILNTMVPFEAGADLGFAFQTENTQFPSAFPSPFPTLADGELGILEGADAAGSAGGGGLPSQAGAAQSPLPESETAVSMAQQAITLTQTATSTATASATATTNTPTATLTAAPSASLTPLPTTPAPFSADGVGVILIVVAVMLLGIALLTTLTRIRRR